MRSPYVKVALFVDPKTNLSGARVVGQGEDYLLLERAAPKEKAKPVKRGRPRKTDTSVVTEVVSA